VPGDPEIFEMRILFLANDFPSAVHPSKGVFNRHLVEALSRIHAVEAIVPISWLDELRAPRAAKSSLARSGRSSAVGSASVVYPRYYYPPRVLHDWYAWFYWRSVRRAARRASETFKPDVVLAYWAHPDGAVAARVARLAGVPSAVIVGGSDVLLITRQASRRRRVLAALRAVNAVICVNRHLRGATIELGVEPGKVHVWQQGVSPIFSPGDRAEARRRLGLNVQSQIVIWVGRMVPVKGLDVLLEACSALKSAGSRVRVFLLGDGPLRSRIQEDIAHRGLEEMVTLAGTQPQERLAEWYRATDLTVLPSRSEGLPNVLRESLACGTPFVASDVGGISEIATEQNAILVPPEAPGALATAIADMLGRGAPPDPPDRSPSPTWGESALALTDILSTLVEQAAARRAHVDPIHGDQGRAILDR
jgi:glycosyltransferase involved in cell wall biosynthesis